MSIDHEIAEAIDTMIEDIKSFKHFWVLGDHVMYRKVATDVFNAAKFVRNMVDIVEDVDDDA